MILYLVIGVYAWINGVLFGMMFKDIQINSKANEKRKAAEKFLEFAENAAERSYTIMRQLEGVKLIVDCENIANIRRRKKK